VGETFKSGLLDDASRGGWGKDTGKKSALLKGNIQGSGGEPQQKKNGGCRQGRNGCRWIKNETSNTKIVPGKAGRVGAKNGGDRGGKRSGKGKH